MAEYIKREDALKAMEWKWAGKAAFDAVKAIPTADVVERKHGKWVEYPECLKYPNAYSDDHIVCSACEECFSILDNDCERFHYCPNCGSYMEDDI